MLELGESVIVAKDMVFGRKEADADVAFRFHVSFGSSTLMQ